MKGENWRVVFDEAALEYVVGRPRRERQILFEAFDRLRSDPYREAEFTNQTTDGREISVQTFRPFVINYWVDHYVKEIRILDIEKVRF